MYRCGRWRRDARATAGARRPPASRAPTEGAAGVAQRDARGPGWHRLRDPRSQRRRDVHGVGGAGVFKASAGTVLLDGEDVTSLPIHARARHRLAFVPEVGAPFPGLTVAENLVVGDRGASRQDRREILEGAASLFPLLATRWHERAGMLSGGEQQMVSLSRVLVHSSAVVVIDEPSHRLARAILEQLSAVLASFRGEMTLVLIVQDVKCAGALANHVVMLSHGEVALADAPTT